ncbi:MAG: MBL fold metallo-hydrolase [Chloroflexi bacterium]|nr:MBL fold metallo-hydrolase [Chloroflexota bacterium]MCL5076256.1 MBL fold metallo-hydrolase [Chloroflexota bacterium]
MEIIWLGHSCFRLKSRDAVLLIDPYDKSIGYNLGKPTADIVAVTHQHPGHAHTVAIAGNPKIISGPGEYEVKGVVITGIRTFHDDENGQRLGKNTAYLVEMDDLVICHLGDLGHVLTAEQVEALSDVNILLVPVGGFNTINASQAVEIINLVEPKIAIPMHYKTEAAKVDLDPLDRFTHEIGLKHYEPQPKLVVNKGSLPEELEITVLEYRKL